MIRASYQFTRRMFIPSRNFVLLAGILLALSVQAKSLRELRIGGTEFGYRYSGGVDATVAGNDYDACYHGIYLGYRLPFRPFAKERARITWDSSVNISVLDSDNSPLSGNRMGIRTGVGFEYLIVQQWLVKLDLGMDFARVSTTSSSGLAPKGSGWEFGGHIEGSILYSPHPRVTAFMGLGLETLGQQTFYDVELDAGASPTFSTGIFFPW